MSEHITKTSMELSELLDHAVGTKEVIKCRRFFIDMCSRILTLAESTNQIHLLGSRCDGLLFETSDIDAMRSIKELAVVHSKQIVTEYVPRRLLYDHLLVVCFPSSSTYVCIDVFITHQHSISKYIYQVISKSVIHYSGRLLLSSSLFVENIDIEGNITGPAMANCIDFSLPNDFVNAFHCKMWPEFAFEWVHRNRIYSWPNKGVISLASSAGYNLVPVGEHDSNMSSVHWRTSFVLQECLLVRTFNQVQLKTYALVKMIKNEYLSKYPSPTTGESLITSYHVKTLMFWTIENTPQHMWTDRNIIYCFQSCLVFLRNFVVSKYLPHYFVPTCNLFKKQTDFHLLNIINDLNIYIKCPVTVILDLHPALKNVPSFCDIEEQIGGVMTLVCLDVFKLEPKVILSAVLENGNAIGKLDFQLSYGMLVRSLAYRLSLNTNHGDTRAFYTHERKSKYIRLMHICLDFTSGWLQLATYLYKTGQYAKSHDIIHKKVIGLLIHSTANSGNVLDIMQLFHKYLNLNSRRKCRESSCTYLALFLNFVVPKQLDIETKLWDDIGLHIANITPLPYAYFLSFLCAYQDNDDCQQMISLLRLKSMLNGQLLFRRIGHDLVKFVVLNMIGICCEMRGNNRNAKHYYRKATSTAHLFTEKLMVMECLHRLRSRCIVDGQTNVNII